METVIERDGASTNAPPPLVTIRKPQFDGRSYNWRHEETIRAVFDGEHVPASADEAEELLQERFGCVYKALPEELRRDRRLLLIAAAQSAGHELAHAPEDMRAELDAAFFMEAIRLGARGWILQWANDAVKNDPAVAMDAVRNDGCAIRYLSAGLRRDEAIQLAAVHSNEYAAQYMEEPHPSVLAALESVRDAARRRLG